jgi:hypothetical protein
MLAYHNDYFYSKLYGSGFHQLTIDIVNEFDVVKIAKRSQLSSNDYIDLILSSDDLKDISTNMKLFIEQGYIRDEINPWRKAKVLMSGNKEKVEYKFHGTDAVSMLARIPFLDKLKIKLGFNNISSVSPIDSGTFSLKIKHKKKSNYYNLMRRYQLINPYDSHEISTTIINKIASKLGLIAPYGRTVILRINGSEIGPYMLVEAHNKEWFEREHQLTNYTIFKSNDDWDRKESSHSADTDLYIENKEVNTSSMHSSVATGALELLLESIRGGNIEQVKRMIDVDYMARYMALLAIINDAHSVTGDNLKYIYNHQTGRFKLLFREENTATPNRQGVDMFNRSFFLGGEGENIATLRMFKLLLTDEDFLTKRDNELNKIVLNNDQWLTLIDEVVAENMRVLLASSIAIRPIQYKVDRFKNILSNNINQAKQYLNYNKIFITKYTDIDGERSLRIINDFVHPIILGKTYGVNDKNESIIRNTNVFISPSRLDIDQNVIYEEQKVALNILNTLDINQLSFENIITGRKILPRHIYFNDAIERPVLSKERSLQTLSDNHIDYEINHKDKLLKIQSGQYKVDRNIVTPYGFNVTINKNTKFLLNENVSFLVRGGLDIKGTMEQPVIFDRKKKDASFGVFAVMGEKIENTKVNINHLKFNGGNEAIIDGVLYTGQMTIINANVSIKNSIFQNSKSDDGINIKYSKVDISNSKFVNNSGDQIDLDYCQAIIINNVFSSAKVGNLKEEEGTDGLDVSGSKVQVLGNTFSNSSDKGISVGEASSVFINDNIFINNNIAIAVKDASKAFVGKNNFNINKVDISMYVKKKIYNNPVLYSLPSNKILNLEVGSNSIFYSDNLNKDFLDGWNE